VTDDTDADVTRRGPGELPVTDAAPSAFNLVVIIRHRPLHVIAKDIERSWQFPTYRVRPFLLGMRNLDHISDSFGFRPGREIVRYFLMNAVDWKGSAAARIKAELGEIIGWKP